MKKWIFSLLIFIVTLSAFTAPYGDDGYPTRWTQPNGTTLELKVFGDEYYAVTRTEEHYTVVLDTALKAYCYAKINADSTQLISSGIIVDSSTMPLAESYMLDLPYEVRLAITTAKREAEAALTDPTIPSALETANTRILMSRSASTTRNIKSITMLVCFSGDDPTKLVTREQISNMLNQPNYKKVSAEGNSGSVYDYFYEQSHGKVAYTNYVTPYIQLDKPIDYYNYKDWNTNKDTPRYFGDAGKELLDDVFQKYKEMNDPEWDAQTFTLSPANTMSVNFVYVGYTIGFTNGLWPHRTNTTYPFKEIYKGVKCYDYQISNIVPHKEEFPLGTFIHENGHMLFSFPDLYDVETGGSKSGIGNHCLMATGGANNAGYTPAPINAALKYMEGWITAEELSTTEAYPDFEMQTNSPHTYRFVKPNKAGEYFLLEPRHRSVGKFSGAIPADGLLVWHVDEVKMDNRQVSSNNKDYHGRIHLVQADRRFDLEIGTNKGDATDAFGADAYKEFNATTGLRTSWWDGSASNIKMYNINMGTNGILAMGIGERPSGAIFTSQLPEIIPGIVTSIPWTFSDGLSGTIKIELFNRWEKVLDIATNINLADENYDWLVPSTLPVRPDYQIKITLNEDPLISKNIRNLSCIKEYTITPNQTLTTTNQWTAFPLEVPDEGTIQKIQFRVHLSDPNLTLNNSKCFLGYVGTSGASATTTDPSKIFIGRDITISGMTVRGTGFTIKAGNEMKHVIFNKEATGVFASSYTPYSHINPIFPQTPTTRVDCYDLTEVIGKSAKGTWNPYLINYGTSVTAHSFGLRFTFDWPTLSMSQADASVNMGQTRNVAINLTGAAPHEIKLPFKIEGSAIPSTHYTITTSSNLTYNTTTGWGEITIPKGATSAQIPIVTVANAQRIGNRYMQLTLDYTDKIYFETNFASQRINLIDVLPPPEINFTTTAISKSYREETFSIPLTLSTTSQENISVQYDVTGTADSVVDFTCASGLISIEPGQNSAVIPFKVLTSSRTTPTEVVIVLSNPSNVTMGEKTSFKVLLYPITTVSSLTVSQGTRSDGIRLTWSVETGKEYRISRMKTSGESTFSVIRDWGTETTGEYLDSNTIPGENYSYKVEERYL